MTCTAHGKYTIFIKSVTFFSVFAGWFEPSVVLYCVSFTLGIINKMLDSPLYNKQIIVIYVGQISIVPFVPIFFSIFFLCFSLFFFSFASMNGLGSLSFPQNFTSRIEGP